MMHVPVEVSRNAFEIFRQERGPRADLLLDCGIVKIRDDTHD
jgi:hypothetical protein